MGDIDILKEMLQDDVTVPLEERHHKKQVTLAEPQANYSVPLYGMPNENEVIIIKPDKFTLPKKVFRETKETDKGQHKRADFVIIAKQEKLKVILYIEMKGGKGDREGDIIKQLKGAHCFIAYCRELGQKFWNKPDFLSNYEYRFVSIRDISISKKPTRTKSKQQAIHDSPEKMLKITSPNYLRFDKLVR
ncbi:MAG: hypothetical protein ACRC8Y_25655 [Chroococcales cyanobacterium]